MARHLTNPASGPDDSSEDVNVVRSAIRPTCVGRIITGNIIAAARGVHGNPLDHQRVVPTQDVNSVADFPAHRRVVDHDVVAIVQGSGRLQAIFACVQEVPKGAGDAD